MRLFPVYGFALFIIQLSFRYSYAEEVALTYKTREEKRDAAKQYEITDRLSISAIAEIEHIHRRQIPIDKDPKSHDDGFSKSIDVELEIDPVSWVTAEIVYEYDDDINKFILDEAVAKLEWNDFELELGKQYLPFGEFFSHFVTDSALDFAETIGKGATLSYTPDDKLDLSVFVYSGDAQKLGSTGIELDWGLAAETQFIDKVTLGLSYNSDLADSKEALLTDQNHLYINKVSGLGAYALVEFGAFEITAEWIQSLDTFQELDADRNEPQAWNLELAHFPHNNFEWALRIAGSKEIEDAAEQQIGVAATWRVHPKVGLTLEYLRSEFTTELAEDINGNILDKVNQVGGRISVLF